MTDKIIKEFREKFEEFAIINDIYRRDPLPGKMFAFVESFLTQALDQVRQETIEVAIITLPEKIVNDILVGMKYGDSRDTPTVRASVEESAKRLIVGRLESLKRPTTKEEIQ